MTCKYGLALASRVTNIPIACSERGRERCCAQIPFNTAAAECGGLARIPAGFGELSAVYASQKFFAGFSANRRRNEPKSKMEPLFHLNAKAPRRPAASFYHPRWSWCVAAQSEVFLLVDRAWPSVPLQPASTGPRLQNAPRSASRLVNHPRDLRAGAGGRLYKIFIV